MPVVALSIPAIKNNLRMNDFKSQLFSVPLPPGAEVTDRGTRFGLLDQPASNGCNYVAWLDLAGTNDPEAVEQHYRAEVGDIWLRVEQRREVVHIEIEQGRDAGWDLRCT